MDRNRYQVLVWDGGVLEKRGDSYVEKILSPKQLEVAKVKFTDAKVNGLAGMNFEKLGILE